MNNRFFVLTIFILFISPSLLLYSQSGKVKGRVIEKNTRLPIVGVNIIVQGTQYGGTTDSSGNYSILNIPSGIYSFKFSCIGFETKIETDIVIKSNRVNFINKELESTSIKQKDVLIISGYFEKLSDSPVSSQSLNNEEIRRSPGSREDVSRMLQNFPGVNPTSDDRNDLVIRGGNPAEVQFLIDNVEIPNPNHFGTQGATGGPIGMINTEFIEKADFYSGGFTAGYGNKLSGVMDIHLRNGNSENLGGKVDLNFGGVGGYIESPFFNGKGSFLVGVHRSFLELFKGVLNSNGTPVYSNTQGKITYNFNPIHQLSFLWLTGYDKIDINYSPEIDDFEIEKTDTNIYQNINFKSFQFTAGSTLKSIWNDKFYSTLTFSHTYSNFHTDVFDVDLKGFHSSNSDKLSDKQEINNKICYSNSSTEQITNLKLDLSWTLNKNLMLTSGINVKSNAFNHKIRYIPFHSDRINQYGLLPESWNVNVNYKSLFKYGSFINLKQNLYSNLIMNAGIRIDYFDLLNKISFSPRFTLLYDINEKLSIHSGYGIYYQNPEFIWISIHRDNKNTLKDLRCDHLILGVNYLITPGLKISLEGYYKNYNQYPTADEKGYEMISMANTGADYGVSLITQKLASKGKGYSKGIEVMLQQKTIKSIYGILSYSYSKTEHLAVDGIFRAGAFDNRNVFNLILGYKINIKNEFSLKYKYATGRPYTPFDLNKSIAEGEGILNLNKINSQRYEDYQKLDLRYDNREFHQWGTITWYISVENVLGRKNVLSHYWNRARKRTDFNYQTTLFFVGGASFEF